MAFLKEKYDFLKTGYDIYINCEGEGERNPKIISDLKQMEKLLHIYEKFHQEIESQQTINSQKRRFFIEQSRKPITKSQKFYKFPSIFQFKDIIKHLKYHSEKWESKLPVLQFQGTVKLHGSHGDVVYDNGQIYCQSRNKIVSVIDDNMGFAKFIDDNLSVVEHLFDELKLLYPGHIYVLHGEWCGGNIQKNVALTQLNRMFIIYKCSIRKDQNFKTLNTIPDHIIKNMVSEKHNIYNIFMFPVYYIDIDFENPQLIQNNLIELTDNVEKKCPVGEYFGVSGIGEGIVWTCHEKNYHSSDFVFKVKGEEHSVSKVRTLVPVDTDKLKNIQEFLDNTVTENRLNQGLEYLTEFKIPLDKSSIKPFSDWILTDILKEESDLITENNFNIKEITGKIKSKACKWFVRNV